MKILYKPFGIIATLIGAKIARNIFNVLWSRIDAEAPPSPTTEDASFPKIVGAAAQGAERDPAPRPRASRAIAPRPAPPRRVARVCPLVRERPSRYLP